jgi:hypothetical protein
LEAVGIAAAVDHFAGGDHCRRDSSCTCASCAHPVTSRPNEEAREAVLDLFLGPLLCVARLAYCYRVPMAARP